jgi:hypothetical protein
MKLESGWEICQRSCSQGGGGAVTYRQGNLGCDSVVWQSGADGLSMGVGGMDLDEADSLVRPIGDLVSKDVVRELRDDVKEGFGRALDEDGMARPASPGQADGASFGNLQGTVVDREDAH